MDIINNHYEKIILVVCLVLMVLGLMKVGGIVRLANDELDQDERQHVSRIDESSGNMVADFDPTIFDSKEGWIQRVKTNQPAPVRQISEIVSKAAQGLAAQQAGKDCDTEGDAIIKAWDRRYFNVLTRHSRKPIEEAEAKYRLDRNRRELESLKRSIALCQENIKKRIEENGDSEDDAKLAELRLQLDGFQALLANTEMDIVDLNKRVKYISMFCTAQGSLVDPQEVVCCVNSDCGALILSSEDICPFCGTRMPIVNPAEEEGKDSDQDGLPDSFEREHMQKRGFLTADVQRKLGLGGQDGMGMGEPGAGRGTAPMEGAQGGASEQDRALNPYNASDAYADFDGDSFTNLEEFQFGTDIDDAESFPEPANYVRLVEFKQDKFPVRFMGIKEGRGDSENKLKQGRAKLSYMLNYRVVSNANNIGVKEFWNSNEDSWENVRVGKKFEAPDGKSYVVDELGSEDVGGKSRTFVKLSEYVPPVRGRRASKEGEQPEAAKAPARYTLYEGEDGYYADWYAHVIYLVHRSYGALPVIFNNRYRITSGARSQFVRTRFKLAEGEVLKVQVPISEIEEAPAEKKQSSSRLRAFGRQNDMGDGMGGGDWRSSPEVKLKTVEYKVGKFDRDKKSLVLTWGEGKKAKTMDVKLFKEDETFRLPESGKRLFPLFYQGGSNFGGEGGMMEPGMGRGMGGGMGAPAGRMPFAGRGGRK